MKQHTIQLAVILAVLAFGLVGWSAYGHVGAGAGLALGLILVAMPWRRQPLWSWLGRYLRRNRPIPLSEPSMVANDRSGGGVRYQDGVAIVCVQLLGKAHVPTMFTGSTAAATRNTIDVGELVPAMRQSLGLTIESLSVVISGSRRRSTGDYPRVYDTLIGTPPYAGQRETCLMIRLRALENAQALQCRTTVGTAALAAAQRIAASLRCKGIRARVATATDMVELERRLGRIALESHNQRWRTARGDAGWLTTYAYQPRDINAEVLAAAWSLRADGIIQNITLFPDGTATATITVRSAQPPTAPPSVKLKTLPGEQASAVAANLGGPRPELHGLTRGRVPAALVLPIGPSGVLLGKVNAGDRMLLPCADPGEFSRIHIAAEDSVAKRIIIRTAGAGDRITVHTRDLQRWESVRMPHIAVSDQPRPASGTTVSVVDGSVSPAPRPNTVISVGRPDETQRGSADVVIKQIGPATVEVTAGGQVYVVDVELFRTENRYVSSEPMSMRSEELESAD
jgi:type VII secretion protein EccE